MGRDSDAPRRTTVVCCVAALVLGTLLIYAPVIGFGFLPYDDPEYVQLHPRTSRGLSGENLRWAATAVVAGNWHPLALVSHMADVSILGLRPGAHHAVNALLHAVDAALLFALFLTATRRLAPSLLTAALFAAHPLNVESVAWISQRKTVLCMMFLLASLLAHVAWSRRRRPALYVACLLSLAASLAAKPAAVVAPALLLLLDVWPLGRWPAQGEAGWLGARRLLVEKIPHAVLAGAAAVATLAAQRSAGAVGTLESFPMGPRLARATFASAWYVLRMAWPEDLSLFYPVSLGPTAAWRAAGATALLAGVTALVLVQRRRRPYLGIGWAWYLTALLPVVGLVQFGTQIVADRYAYLPLIGPFFALAFLAADAVKGSAPGPRALAALAGVVAVAACAVASRQTLAPWGDSRVLFERGARRAPDNAHAMANLGLVLADEGRIEESIAVLERAERVAPRFGRIQSNLAHAYALAGRLEPARAHYERALDLQGRDAELLLELGWVLVGLGRVAEAESVAREAMSLGPADARVFLFLGTLLYSERRIEEARPFLDRAVALAPSDPRALTALGLELEALGRREEAIAALRKAASLPGHPARTDVELGRILGAAAREEP